MNRTIKRIVCLNRFWGWQVALHNVIDVFNVNINANVELEEKVTKKRQQRQLCQRTKYYITNKNCVWFSFLKLKL